MKQAQLIKKDDRFTWLVARALGLGQCPKDWKSATSTTPWPMQKKTANTHYIEPKRFVLDNLLSQKTQKTLKNFGNNNKKVKRKKQ